ncbi:DUF6457 domain-containing protein [Nocardioides litoris]|uniref:DUF6457 domain-containing protein n=1 Tax=Nocardioides litoris TaxID=1926648 RepID=UPI001477453C|nr:DUF6457 domain-containing protein [Nocardioides litoris]
MNLHDWIDELSDVLDLETEVDEGLLADLDELVHDSVGRGSGPVATYLLGYAAGSRAAGPADVERMAAAAQALAEGWDRPADAPDPDDVDDDVPDDRGIDHTGDLADAGDATGGGTGDDTDDEGDAR